MYVSMLTSAATAEEIMQQFEALMRGRDTKGLNALFNVGIAKGTVAFGSRLRRCARACCRPWRLSTKPARYFGHLATDQKVGGSSSVRARLRHSTPRYPAGASELPTARRECPCRNVGSRAPDALGLPPTGEVEFVVLGRSTRLFGGAAALAAVIEQHGPEIWAHG
jgi:hypothetical protein